MASDVIVEIQARSQSIADMIQQCADGDLPFSGPNSLCSKVHAMGFRTTSLYEMVMATKIFQMTSERKDGE